MIETGAADRQGIVPAQRGGWLVLFQVLAILLGLYCVEQDIEGLLLNAHVISAGTLGVAFDIRGGARDGFIGLARVDADGPMARAGIAPSDTLRFDRVFDPLRRLRAGETIGFTVDHQGRQRHMRVTTVPQPTHGPLAKSFWTTDTANNASCLIASVLGLFIVLRSRRHLTTILLGAGLITYGMASALPQLSTSSAAMFMPAFLIGAGNFVSIPILFYAFALCFYREHVGAPKRRGHALLAYALLAIYAVLHCAGVMALTHYLIYATPLPIIGNGYNLSTLLSFTGFIIAFGYLFAGWRRSAPENQQRYAILLLAASAIILAQALANATFFLTFVPEAMTGPMVIAGSILGGLVAPVLFTYAILRHKVLDLGFAINRTVVYGVVSAVLLVAFGLCEWAVEHFLPIESHEASVFIDAGIALAIFLVFHHVRDFVEHNIETLFFHKWHQKEAELKRFVQEAGFILKRDAMITAYVAAMRKFCDGADAALYLADNSGAYRLAQGGLPDVPAVLDSDDPFMVTLRADRTAFEPGVTRIAAIALALPMIHRTEVIGVTLLGAKPSGFAYRPDEKDALAHAAHQIGLDLHALEIERLQQANSALEVKYAELRSLTEGRLSEGRLAGPAN